MQDWMTECPTCGEPRVVTPPPLATDVAAHDAEIRREVKTVGAIGGILTSITIAASAVLLLAGGFLTIATGCCGAFNGFLGNKTPDPAIENPFAPYIVPGVAILIGLWVVLAIFVFVIRKRKIK